MHGQARKNCGTHQRTPAATHWFAKGQTHVEAFLEHSDLVLTSFLTDFEGLVFEKELVFGTEKFGKLRSRRLRASMLRCFQLYKYRGGPGQCIFAHGANNANTCLSRCIQSQVIFSSDFTD